jgi:hypothetical protein
MIISPEFDRAATINAMSKHTFSTLSPSVDQFTEIAEAQGISLADISAETPLVLNSGESEGFVQIDGKSIDESGLKEFYEFTVAITAYDETVQEVKLNLLVQDIRTVGYNDSVGSVSRAVSIFSDQTINLTNQALIEGMLGIYNFYSEIYNSLKPGEVDDLEILYDINMFFMIEQSIMLVVYTALAIT